MLGGAYLVKARGLRLTAAVVSLSMGCSLFGSKKEYDDDDDNSGSGGQSSGAAGGTKSTGGTKSSGGSNATGGSVSDGGSIASGGSVSTGGSVASGGSHSSGGSVSTGGSVASGGSLSTGGDVGTGGDLSTGGTGGDVSTGGTGGDVSTGGTGGDGATGGSGGTGGSTAGTGGSGGGTTECGSAFAVADEAYVTAPGSSGCWRGFAYTITDSLGSTATPATFAGCTGAACNLCASGTVVGDSEYGGYAGLGFNLSQDPTPDAPQGAVVPSGSALSVSFSNPGGSQLRIQLQDASTQWCYTLVGSSGTVQVPYSSFNTQCWDTTGIDARAYAGEPITGIQLTIPGSGVANTAYDICLTGAKDL